MQAEEYFAKEWPAELPRLRRMLGRNGISLDAIDDVLQESALRLFSAWGRVFEDRPLRPLVNTIVLNAARDHHRRTRYEVHPVGDFPETLAVDPRGADEIVLARLDLQRTGRALTALSDKQRQVVASAVSDELAGEDHGRVRAPAATRMAVSRARRRLVEVLEVTAAGVGLVAGMARRGSSRRGVRPAVALAALAVAASVLLDGGAVAPAPGQRDLREPTAARSAPDDGARTGVAEWQYDRSGVSPDSAVSSRVGGTTRWTWQHGSFLSVSAFGAQVQIGDDGYQPHCTLDVAGRIEVGHRCLPRVEAVPSAR